jgi:hypothetical protein
MLSRRMSDFIEIGQIVPRNGSSKSHRRSSKSFWLRIIGAPFFGVRPNKTKTTAPRDSRFSGIG